MTDTTAATTTTVMPGKQAGRGKSIALLVIALAVIIVVILALQAATLSKSDDTKPTPTPSPTASISPTPADNRESMLHILGGTPLLTRSGISLTAYEGMVLYEGDKLEVPASSGALLVFDEGMLLTLEQGSTIELTGLQKQSEIGLSISKGRVWVRALKLSKDQSLKIGNLNLQMNSAVFMANGNLVTIEGEVFNLDQNPVVTVQPGRIIKTDGSVELLGTQPGDEWFKYQLCLDNLFTARLTAGQTIAERKAAAASIYSESTECSKILGAATSTSTPTPKPTTTVLAQPTSLPTSTPVPSPAAATITAAQLEIVRSQSHSVVCSWDLQGSLQANQQLFYSLWKHVEGADDLLVIDWTLTGGTDTVMLGQADTLGLLNQEAYYCKLKLQTGSSETIEDSEKAYYDLSEGTFNVSEPSGYFRGEVEGDGRFENMSIVDVRMRFYVQLDDPTLADYGKYCTGSDSWSPVKSWIEAPLVVSINNLFLFNRDSFSCNYAGNYEQAAFHIQMLNRRTGAVLFEQAYPVALD